MIFDKFIVLAQSYAMINAPNESNETASFTVTLDARLLRQMEAKASELGISVSQLIEKSLRNSGFGNTAYEEAMLQYLSLKPTDISSGKPYPKRDQLYDRSWPR